MPEELKAAMQGLADKAVQVLDEAMGSSDERVRVLAAGHVLDRGYGKPAQTVNNRLENMDLTDAHLEALRALAAKPIRADADDCDNLMNPAGTA
jgi:hypothetical protein